MEIDMDSGLRLPFGKIIAFHPALSWIMGDNNDAALYLQQLLYWNDKGSREDGFIYKTKKEIQYETRLTREKQDHIRKKLERMGILETKLLKANGTPTLHYKISIKRVQAIIDDKCETHKPESVKDT